MFTAHAQKRLFMSFRSKIWPCHSLRRPRFSIRRVYLTLTFDLLTLRCLMKIHTYNARTAVSLPIF